MQRRTRWATPIVGALATVLTAGCTSTPDEPRKPASPREQVVALPDGGRLIVPAGAFLDGTDISVSTDGAPPTPTDRAGLTGPVDVTADGPQPATPLTLEFPYDPADVPAGVDPADVMGVSTYDEERRTWEPLDVTFDTNRHVMTATSPTLSWKWPWQWDWPAIGAGINQRAGELAGKRAPAATCPRGTAVPRWVQSVTTVNDDAAALRTCAESDKGALVIEMVNNRPYGVVMNLDAPTRWRWQAQPDDPAELLAMLLLNAALPKDKLYVPPLGQASIGIKKGTWRRAELRTEATRSTIVATYLTLAFGDMLTNKTAKAVAGALVGTCVSGFIKTNADATVESLTDVRTVVPASMSCVSKVLEGQALDKTLTKDQRTRAKGSYKALAKVAVWVKLYSAEWNLVDLLFDKLRVGATIVPVHVRAPLLTASGDGLGEWQFGDPATEVLAGMNDWFGPPDYDPGWDEFVQKPEYGDGWYPVDGDQIAPTWDNRFFRPVCWQSLCSIFGGDTEATATFRGWELSRWQAWNGYADADISEPRIALADTGLQVGDTWEDFSAAYPGAEPGGGEGMSLVIDGPPWPGIFDGVGAWRLDGRWDPSRPTDAPGGSEVTRMSGGTAPEPGCC